MVAFVTFIIEGDISKSSQQTPTKLPLDNANLSDLTQYSVEAVQLWVANGLQQRQGTQRLE